jgi:hypothetical protein
MHEGMGALAPPATGEMGAERELRVVVEPVMRPTQRHDAVGVIATAVLAWHEMSRIDWRAIADDAVQLRDLRALLLRRRDERGSDESGRPPDARLRLPAFRPRLQPAAGMLHALP